MANTSMYIPDDVLDEVKAAAVNIDRSRSYWVTEACREKLAREGRPVVPAVVKRFDERAGDKS